ncbi:hypothetical protein H9649_05950 [Sporosarcina sp. Sa2YVA2]|uniref:Uncharacterized protein n=1 Tax=Sporosarcina quadrami TaxID=2762234 RepID=A0ABR8U7U1_9BACL|nr:hypothetical protein [Sporosarcina quadrami]MBD7984115.1 hypothetical protein [Sporosarcina quadrami]
MNKFIATALSTVLLTTGGIGAANVLHPDKVEAAQAKYEASYSHHNSNYQLQIASEDLTQLPEYATITSKIDVNGLTAKVVEDNYNTRTIVFSNANGQGKYKSIFVKKTDSLKVIDFRGGQIFYGTISNETTAPAPEQNPSTDTVISTLPEFATLASVVKVSNYTLQVVEDNTNKRIITLKDQNGRLQYKSIFVKNNNSLKVIDTRGGQIFYGTVGTETAATPAVVKPAPAKAVAKAAPVKTEVKAQVPVAKNTSSLPEYATLASVVNVNDFSLQVVEDNSNTRTILLKDKNNRVQYKSIFIKRTNNLKVIQTRGGQIFYGSIK